MNVSAPAGQVGAPAAPGRMGVAIEPSAALAYLDQLAAWRTLRRAELDALDSRAMAAPNGASATNDIMLSMALWKAVSDRYEQLVTTWDSGRVGATERLRLANLIWGRLDTAAASGLSVSVPEACRLSDALVAQLRVRLGLDPSGAEILTRIRQLRAQMERIRDQVDLEPAGHAQQQAAGEQSRLARRLKDLADKAGRGGDVAGLLGPLEIEAATFERDLIVNGALRRDAAELVRRARDQRAHLTTRQATLRLLVDQAVNTVDPAPRYAVPDVDALGPVPNTAASIEEYLHRLDSVSRAMTMAHNAYAAAVKEHQDLAFRLEALQVKASATGVAEVAEVASSYGLAHSALDQRPCRMIIARQLVALYQSYLDTTRPESR